MACRINRNERGEIESVLTKQGEESVLFDSLNIAINNGASSEVAYVAYLETLRRTPSMGLGEPNISSGFAQGILKEIDNDYLAWEAAAKTMKHETAKSRLEESLYHVLDKMGVNVTAVDNIKDNNGNKLGVTGAADVVNRTIELVSGKATIDTLTEETAHFMVEILRAENNPLYDSMYQQIEKYSIFKDISDPGSMYYEQYKGDVDMLKREAIAQVIMEHVVKGESKQEPKGLLARLKRWFDRVLRSFGVKVGKVTKDSFGEAAWSMMNKDLSSVFATDPKSHTLPNVRFFQEEKLTSIIEKLDSTASQYEIVEIDVANVTNAELKKYFTPLADEVNGKNIVTRYQAKENSPFKGKILKMRGSDLTALSFKDSRQFTDPEVVERRRKDMDIRMKVGTLGHKMMEDLVGYYFHGKGSISEIKSRKGSFKEAQFKELQKSVQLLKSQVVAQQKIIDPEGKMLVRTEQMIADEINDVGGTIDLLIIYSDGSASVYDYKFKTPSMYGKYRTGKFVKGKGIEVIGDMFASSLEGYDFQIGAYRDALLSKYGVTKMRHSRIIPVAVVYERNKETQQLTDNILKLEVWTGSKGGQNPFLEHIPVAMELTGDEKIDKLIKKEMNRFNGLVRQLESAKFKDKESLHKRMSTSRKIIKDLQLRKDIASGLKESFRRIRKTEEGLKEVEEYIEKDGEIIANPKYLTDRELRELYNELKHFQAFSSLPEIISKLEKGSDNAKALAAEASASAGKINRGIEGLKEAMILRMVEKSKKLNINNIKYNRPGTATQYVAASAHKNPYSRYIHQTMQSIKGMMIKAEKQLAEEIYAKEQSLFEYADNAGISRNDAFKELIDPTTGNLYAKYSPQFYADQKAAKETSNITFMKNHHKIKKEYYTKVFKDWKKTKFKEIDNATNNVDTRRKRKEDWSKKYDVVNYDSAWTQEGGEYFLIIDETKTQSYYTESYQKIKTTPALLDFYEYHRDKIREFGHRFGMHLGETFIANVQKTMVDSLIESDNKLGDLTQSVKELFQVRSHFQEWGDLDVNGKHIRKIPRLYTKEIENSKGEIDRSLRSNELGRSLYLLGKASLEYEHLTRVEDELLLLETILTEGLIDEVAENTQGKAIKESLDSVRKIFGSTSGNAELFTDMVDKTIYGRSLKTADSVSEGGFSRNKSLLTLKTYASINALGLKAPVALGALGAGFVGLYIQGSKGIHYNNTHLVAAEKALIGRDPKIRAILDHFEIAILDVSKRRGDSLSSNWRAKYLTGDRWFEFLAQADKLIDATLAGAMAMNHGLDSEGNLKRLTELPEGSKSLWDTVDIKENSLWKPNAPVDKYKVKFEGMSDAAFDSFRARVHRMSTKTKGTTAPEDVLTANMSLLNRFFLHYRSWLPGIAFERFGNIRYDHVMDHFDQGTWRGFFGNFGPESEFDSMGQLLDTEVGIHNYAAAVGGDIVRIALDISTFGLTSAYDLKEGKAKQQFDMFLLDNVGNADFAYTNDVEKEAAFQKFLELKRGNIKGTLAELRSVILLLSLLSMMGGDWDDDGKVDVRKTWTGRKLHNIMGRIYRETAFFWDPRELTGPRSSGIPLLSLGQDFINLIGNSIDEIGDEILGENAVTSDRTPRGYYTLKFAPGLGGLGKALEIYPAYKNQRS